MLGSGDGARSTLNSMSKPGTQDKTTQKPGARTAHERSKKPNTTKRKTGARQKAHQRQAPGEPDRRSQKEQGGSRTQVSPFTFWAGPVLGSAPFLYGSVFGSAPFASCVLKRQRSISSFALRTPTLRFVSRALEADTVLSCGVGALWGERQA